MLLKIPGQKRTVYGKMKMLVTRAKTGMALWVRQRPVSPRKTRGWLLDFASPEEESALKAAGYRIPRPDEVYILSPAWSSLGGASGRGEAKRRPSAHYRRMVERRRELGILSASNREKARVGRAREKGLIK